MKFMIDCWFRHSKFKNVVIKIIDRKTTHTYMVEFYTLSKDKPVFVCKSLCYFFKGDSEWEDYEP